MKIEKLDEKLATVIEEGGLDSVDWHLGRMTLKALEDNRDEINQIEAISGQRETCGSFRSRMIRLATSFRSEGLRVGDVVLVCAVNHNDANVPLMASLLVGTVPTYLVVGMTKSEVNHFVSTAKPKLIFSDPDMIELIDEVCANLKLKAELISFGEASPKYKSFGDFLAPADVIENFECEDFDPVTTTAFIASSSGTTGLPKLVAVDHRSAIVAMSYLFFLDKRNKIDAEDKMYFNQSPTYWISGIVPVLGSCLFGVARLQMTKPSSMEVAVWAIEKYKPTAGFFSPFLMTSMCKDPNFDSFNLSSLRRMYTGGSVVDFETVKAFQKKLPEMTVVVGYGATEAGLCCSNPQYLHESLGKFYPWCEWKIVDVETNAKLGSRQPGELRIKSSYVMKYFNNPAATAEAFDEEGFYKTGDLIYFDENDYLYIVGRIKDVIKYCNYQIGPAEIELTINQIPGVLSAAVVGIPHSTLGELPLAFVQRTPGSSVSEEDIKEHVKNQLSDYKQLRGGVIFVDELPTTITGKINKKALKIPKFN